MTHNRAGKYVHQLTGYDAFIPTDLPPDPPVNMDAEMIRLLSLADRKLGRLDGVTQILPNPDLFVGMYVQKEAVLSSQIEGTQASFVDVLQVDADTAAKRQDVEEVVNYVKAMKYGMNRLETLPLSLRLLREIHGILLSGVRGSQRNPGDFRTSQNWIGSSGCSLATASFVPPPVAEMTSALGHLENYMYSESDIPHLIRIALIHAQFETIHPFLDGNGRMGRLLIAFWLYQQQILKYPLLYISYYFKKNRTEYYDRLMNIRTKGDWEGWVKFFLEGVAQVADEATQSASEIMKLKEMIMEKIQKETSGKANSVLLLDLLFRMPIITINLVKDELKVSYPTAKALTEHFREAKIIRCIDDSILRNKRYIFTEYVAILERGTEV
ncbi:MAG TPA: Fic family protein [Clostridiaceae bacterium]|nr:Fic family protein [Clostridiaceae bacterium]